MLREHIPHPFPRRRTSEAFLPVRHVVGQVASPDLGGRQVAVPHSHATFTCHVTSEAYSCPSGTFVPQGTECLKAPRRPFEERIDIPRPSQHDLLCPPPGEIVRFGIHHIWGRPTTISYLAGSSVLPARCRVRASNWTRPHRMLASSEKYGRPYRARVLRPPRLSHRTKSLAS